MATETTRTGRWNARGVSGARRAWLEWHRRDRLIGPTVADADGLVGAEVGARPAGPWVSATGCGTSAFPPRRKPCSPSSERTAPPEAPQASRGERRSAQERDAGLDLLDRLPEHRHPAGRRSAHALVQEATLDEIRVRVSALAEQQLRLMRGNLPALGEPQRTQTTHNVAPARRAALHSDRPRGHTPHHQKARTPAREVTRHSCRSFPPHLVRQDDHVRAGRRREGAARR